MKQRLSLWMMSLLFGILPMTAANVTSDPSVLEFGNMWVEGGCIAKLTQRLWNKKHLLKSQELLYLE